LSLAEDYKPPEGGYDEMLTPDGRVRPGWEEFLSTFESMGSKTLSSRWKSVRRLLRENGVTFNAHDSKNGLDRMWEFDPFPVILTSHDWEKLERGLIQRGHLLETLLEDVYGEQRCVKEGWLPPALVYGHPGFLRPCHDLSLGGRHRLLLYSVDLARTAQGDMVALRDRAETPVGCGYALENRLALTRMVPEFFQGKRNRKVAPFFRNLQQTLHDVPSVTPRVVLLSPGSHSPTFFEQAYLAQFLGFDLVCGDDLTVRDNRVYLKLLEGLQSVDVILKRMTDPYCDPLELRSDTVIGVPGLVQAVRAGNVTVANSLGSGWLETPALHAFLPELCRRFLDEELLLSSVRTWWCGQSEVLAHVLDHFDEMVIKPTFTTGPRTALFPGSMSRAKREELRKRVEREPEAFVAQEQIDLSTTPCLHKDGLVARRLVLRTFLTRARDEFTVMPGALSVVSQKPGSVVASLEQGAQSKDSWIVDPQGDRDIPEALPVAGRKQIPLSRGGGDISSRAADNLYWLGRNLERAEGLSRLLRYCVVRLNEEPGVLAYSEVPRLLSFVNPRWKAPDGERDDYASRILELLSAKGKHDGLRPVMDSIHRLLGLVRDRLSAESWRLSNHLYQLGLQSPETLADSQTLLDDLLMAFSAFSGMVNENMTRNHTWRFLDMGKRLERAVHTVGLVRRTLVPRRPAEELLLEAVLEVADVLRTYRWRYPAGLQAAPFLDLLLADEDNPRSVVYQLERMDDHLYRLPDHSDNTPRNKEETLLLRCRATIKLADVQALAGLDTGKGRSALKNFLRDLSRDLPQLSDALIQKYLSHLTPKSQGPTFGPDVLP
jgi:uncharacterized circularly permuted ATP-grasp superfamily protein/uncharacterized alpha-E superfamily protein